MRTFFFIHLLLLTASGYSQKDTIIKAGVQYQGKSNYPVHIILNEPVAPDKSYELINIKSGKRIPAQTEDGLNLYYISEELAPDEGMPSYKLQMINGSPKTAIRFQKSDSGISAFVNNKILFFYHLTESLPPGDIPAYYRRSGFIHPLYSPSGRILTDGFPEGHIHQHGIFSAWVNTSYKGEKVDFWNQQEGSGTVRHHELISMKEGPVYGKLEILLRHHSLKYGDILEEKWTICIYPFSRYFVFDLQSIQENITGDTLFLNKYIYGGMAFRGNREWNKDDKNHFTEVWKILTDKGHDLRSANHTKAEWVSVYGKTGGGISGTTVFGHPCNFRFPQFIRVHPEMPYWCFVPVVEEPFYLIKGKPYISQFRYFVHDGKPEIKRILELKFPTSIRSFDK